jgi:opacity protein-like surface antigen
MKKHFAIALTATCLLTFSLSTQAQDYRQFYLGVKGDIANPSDSDVKGATTCKVEYGFSSGAGVVLGWQPEMFYSRDGNLRFELEGGFHAFGLDTVRANTDPSDDLQAATMLANIYYDWHTNSAFSPYVGVGIGRAHMTLANDQGLGNTGESDNVTAWQAMAGISYIDKSMPNTAWSVGYKYMDFDQPSFSSAGGDIKLDPVHEHTIELGVTYHF